MFVAHYGQNQQFQIHTKTFEWVILDSISIGGRGHLFNRTELCKLCGLADVHTTNDFKLIETLYRKYGTQFADRLLGEYAFIIWDNVQHHLICITDHFNNYGLFYSNNAHAFSVSDDSLILRTLPEVGRQFNVRKIAMGNCFTAVHEPGETFFSTIYYVPAASVMHIDSKKCVSTRQYWEPQLQSVQHYNSTEEFTAAFQDMFTRVIQSHTHRGSVMSLLSGGLDSSAVTAMAANVLLKENKKLTSLSAILPAGYQESVRDERYYIDCLTAPNLNKQFITDPSRGPFDDLDTCLYSPVMTSRHYLYRAFNHTARKHGVNIILDGCFGEMGPSYWGDERLAELLKKGQWLTLFQQSRAHRALFDRSWASMIAHDMLLPNLPTAWQTTIKPRQDLDYIQRFSLLRRDFVEQFMTGEHKRRESDKFKLIGATLFVDGRHNNALRLQNYLKRLGPSNKIIYEHHQSEVRYVYPLRDKRMIEFCLAAPNEWRYRNGYRRNIIRDGMRGIVPREVCDRVSKEPFSPDFHDRYNRQIATAYDYIGDIQHQTLIKTIIDVPRLLKNMKRTMQSNRCQTKNDFICMHIIPSAIYLAAFLHNHAILRPL